jgi:hypothetical protein
MTERGGVDMTTDITTGITSGTTLDIIMGTTAGSEDIAAPEWGARRVKVVGFTLRAFRQSISILGTRGRT